MVWRWPLNIKKHIETVEYVDHISLGTKITNIKKRIKSKRPNGEIDFATIKTINETINLCILFTFYEAIVGVVKSNQMAMNEFLVEWSCFKLMKRHNIAQKSHSLNSCKMKG